MLQIVFLVHIFRYFLVITEKCLCHRLCLTSSLQKSGNFVFQTENRLAVDCLHGWTVWMDWYMDVAKGKTISYEKKDQTDVY